VRGDDDCDHDGGRWSAWSGRCYKTRYLNCGKCGTQLDMDTREEHRWVTVGKKGYTFQMCGNCDRPR
jgi:hypothetical protein